MVQDWLDRGFIKRHDHTKSQEWLVQGFVVPKKSSKFSWRGVVDLRGPNQQTRKCNFLLPKIDDLVKQGKYSLYSIIDLRRAFHQQPLDPESRPYTCTNTPLGIFQWKVNVMGLKNAPGQLQRMMDDVLSPVSDTTTPYIDDVLVGTQAVEGEDL